MTGAGAHAAGTVRDRELGVSSWLAHEDLEAIVAGSGLLGPLPDASRRTEFAIVRHGERQYKVVAYAGAAEAHERVELLAHTGSLFALCLGRVENCLVYEFVEGLHGGRTLPGDVGGFLADLAGIAMPPVRAEEFDAWCTLLEEKSMFLGRTVHLLRAYLREAPGLQIRWDLEYLDAVPKNFVHTSDGQLRCVDPKHLHRGPQGVSLAKLRANIGEYCRREDYEAIRSAYEARVPGSRLDDPAYAGFLLLYYALFFLAVNAGRFPWSVNVRNEMNSIRRTTILGVISAPAWLRALEEARWRIAGDTRRVAELPGRVVRRLVRIAGAGGGRG